jgi:hypothetical protein
VILWFSRFPAKLRIRLAAAWLLSPGTKDIDVESDEVSGGAEGAEEKADEPLRAILALKASASLMYAGA